MVDVRYPSAARLGKALRLIFNEETCFRKNLGSENVAGIPQRFGGKHVVIESEGKEVVEEAEERVLFSLDNERLVRY